MARKKPIPRSARKAINRGTLRSRKKDDVKNISVGLMDIDSAIVYYFNNVIKPMVIENEETIKTQKIQNYFIHFIENILKKIVMISLLFS